MKVLKTLAESLSSLLGDVDPFHRFLLCLGVLGTGYEIMRISTQNQDSKEMDVITVNDESAEVDEYLS